MNFAFCALCVPTYLYQVSVYRTISPLVWCSLVFFYCVIVCLLHFHVFILEFLFLVYSCLFVAMPCLFLAFLCLFLWSPLSCFLVTTFYCVSMSFLSASLSVCCVSFSFFWSFLVFFSCVLVCFWTQMTGK